MLIIILITYVIYVNMLIIYVIYVNYYHCVIVLRVISVYFLVPGKFPAESCVQNYCVSMT